MMTTVRTERLDLVPLTAETIEALGDRERATELVAAAIPADWPDPELAELLPLYAQWLADDPTWLGFGPWLVIARDERTVVGSAGFQGKPDDGSVELGFGIHADFRNRGYASEAARALVDWALAREDVRTVLAKCDPQNAPSVRVLEKIGMTRHGEADGMALWEV